MRVQPVQNRVDAGEHHRLDGIRFLLHQIVRQRREALDVIEMEMREQDLPNLLLLFETKRRPDRPGIDHYRPVDQESAGPALTGLAVTLQQLFGPMASEHANFHLLLPRLTTGTAAT
ncbi:MAG: hypothetical protein A3H49_07855 [Nitrospirae bacterium RIFCSPLOWO2_02_FULL_62_14]|nr:MAG: hypothetical protein A3H49_07855 [Nitrospirae bacterium RIFCSPLOWO2_02_FULL_62_14]